MPKTNVTELDALVVEALPNASFKVQIDTNAPEEYKDRIILCSLSGRMRQFRIRVMPGDKVRLEMTPYDKDRGRITFRSKGQ